MRSVSTDEWQSTTKQREETAPKHSEELGARIRPRRSNRRVSAKTKRQKSHLSWKLDGTAQVTLGSSSLYKR